jgi:hypothetical protein
LAGVQVDFRLLDALQTAAGIAFVVEKMAKTVSVVIA